MTHVGIHRGFDQCLRQWPCRRCAGLADHDRGPVPSSNEALRATACPDGTFGSSLRRHDVVHADADEDRKADRDHGHEGLDVRTQGLDLRIELRV